MPICTDFNFADVASTFRGQFLAQFPIKNVSDDTVVLSMRGSDVMMDCGWTNYWQPPCFFYSDIQQRFANSIVISSDYLNPCVNISIQKGAVFANGSPLDDFLLLAYAKNAAIARSSFTRAGLFMSPVPKNFYVFEGDGNSINSRWNSFMHRYLEFGDHWDCRASPEYAGTLIGKWNGSAVHKAFLLNNTCTWERVTVANRSWVELPPSDHDVGLGWTIRR
jgi:hypothetical protein